jgi:hypothetical protein
MHVSWLVLTLGGLWGVSVARASHLDSASVLTTGLLYGYILWSLYWGGPAFLAWWRGTFLNLGPLVVFGGCGFQMGLAICVLVLVGIPFCTLGGGIYHFSRHWKAARYHN